MSNPGGTVSSAKAGRFSTAAYLLLLVAVVLPSFTVRASTSDLYEQDVTRLAKLRARRADSVNGHVLRPRASATPPPPTYTVALPASVVYSVCPDLTTSGYPNLDESTLTTFNDDSSVLSCDYNNGPNNRLGCNFSTTTGELIRGLDNLCGAPSPQPARTFCFGACTASVALSQVSVSDSGTTTCQITFGPTCTFDRNGVLQEDGAYDTCVLQDVSVSFQQCPQTSPP